MAEHVLKFELPYIKAQLAAAALTQQVDSSACSTVGLPREDRLAYIVQTPRRACDTLRLSLVSVTCKPESKC